MSPGDTQFGFPDRRLAWLARAIVVLLVAGLAAFLIRGANRPKNPSFLSSGGPASPAASSAPDRLG